MRPHFCSSSRECRATQWAKISARFQHNAQRQLTGSAVPQRQAGVGLTLDGMTKGNSVMPAVKIRQIASMTPLKIPNPGDHDKSHHRQQWAEEPQQREDPQNGHSTKLFIQAPGSTATSFINGWKDR